eukprot:GHVN01055875.1.p1 GENE.GHVN01055875.1~~GHVN01055875.1.p1  ORF type:complete len:701 (-),score=71.08 GHVN01055875.1:214-2316(-)
MSRNMFVEKRCTESSEYLIESGLFERLNTLGAIAAADGDSQTSASCVRRSPCAPGSAAMSRFPSSPAGGLTGASVSASAMSRFASLPRILVREPTKDLEPRRTHTLFQPHVQTASRDEKKKLSPILTLTRYGDEASSKNETRNGSDKKNGNWTNGPFNSVPGARNEPAHRPSKPIRSTRLSCGGKQHHVRPSEPPEHDQERQPDAAKALPSSSGIRQVVQQRRTGTQPNKPTSADMVRQSSSSSFAHRPLVPHHTDETRPNSYRPDSLRTNSQHTASIVSIEPPQLQLQRVVSNDTRKTLRQTAICHSTIVIPSSLSRDVTDANPQHLSVHSRGVSMMRDRSERITTATGGMEQSECDRNRSRAYTSPGGSHCSPGDSRLFSTQILPSHKTWQSVDQPRYYPSVNYLGRISVEKRDDEPRNKSEFSPVPVINSDSVARCTPLAVTAGVPQLPSPKLLTITPSQSHLGLSVNDVADKDLKSPPNLAFQTWNSRPRNYSPPPDHSTPPPTNSQTLSEVRIYILQQNAPKIGPDSALSRKQLRPGPPFAVGSHSSNRLEARPHRKKDVNFREVNGLQTAGAPCQYMSGYMNKGNTFGESYLFSVAPSVEPIHKRSPRQIIQAQSSSSGAKPRRNQAGTHNITSSNNQQIDVAVSQPRESANGVRSLTSRNPHPLYLLSPPATVNVDEHLPQRCLPLLRACKCC